jgi:hypothetical protein
MDTGHVKVYLDCKAGHSRKSWKNYARQERFQVQVPTNLHLAAVVVTTPSQQYLIVAPATGWGTMGTLIENLSTCERMRAKESVPSSHASWRCTTSQRGNP